MTRRRALAGLAVALLASSWLAACQGDVAPPPPISPELTAESSFALPRLDATGTPLGPPLCLGLPAVLALVAQPALGVEEGVLHLQTSTLATRLDHAARGLMDGGRQTEPESSVARAIAALKRWGTQGEADWAQAVRQVQSLIVAQEASASASSADDDVARLTAAGVQRFGNVLGFRFNRLWIELQPMPPGTRRPARDGDALLYPANALDALADQAVAGVSVEFVDQSTASILGRLLEALGLPQAREFDDAPAAPASAASSTATGRPRQARQGIQPHLQACAWVRGHETLAFLPYSETTCGLRLLYTADANRQAWFDQPLPLAVQGTHGVPPSPEDRMRQLAV